MTSASLWAPRTGWVHVLWQKSAVLTLIRSPTPPPWVCSRGGATSLGNKYIYCTNNSVTQGKGHFLYFFWNPEANLHHILAWLWVRTFVRLGSIIDLLIHFGRIKTLSNGRIWPHLCSVIRCPCGNSNDRRDKGSHFIPREVILPGPSCTDAHLKPPGCMKPAFPSERVCFHIPHQAPDPWKVTMNWLGLWISLIQPAALRLPGKHVLFHQGHLRGL